MLHGSNSKTGRMIQSIPSRLEHARFRRWIGSLCILLLSSCTALQEQVSPLQELEGVLQKVPKIKSFDAFSAASLSIFIRIWHYGHRLTLDWRNLFRMVGKRRIRMFCEARERKSCKLFSIGRNSWVAQNYRLRFRVQRRLLRVFVPMIMRQRSALLATVVTSVGLHARFRRLSLLPTPPSLTYLIPPIGFFLTYSFRCCTTFSHFFLDII